MREKDTWTDEEGRILKQSCEPNIIPVDQVWDCMPLNSSRGRFGLGWIKPRGGECQGLGYLQEGQEKGVTTSGKLSNSLTKNHGRLDESPSDLNHSSGSRLFSVSGSLRSLSHTLVPSRLDIRHAAFLPVISLSSPTSEEWLINQIP